MGPHWESHVLHRLTKGKHEKIYLSENTARNFIKLGRNDPYMVLFNNYSNWSGLLHI